MMRISNLRRGIAVAQPTSIKLSPSIASRTIIHLPNLPDDEGINWKKEIYVGFIKFLAVCTVYTGITQYIGNAAEASEKEKEEKLAAFYRAKFAAEAEAAAAKA